MLAHCPPASESVPAEAGGRTVAGHSPSRWYAAPRRARCHSPASVVAVHSRSDRPAGWHDRWQAYPPVQPDQAASRTAAARSLMVERGQMRWASQARAPYPTSRPPAPAPSLPEPGRLYPFPMEDIAVTRRSAKSFVPLRALAPPSPYLSGRITRAPNRVKPDHTEDSAGSLPPSSPICRCCRPRAHLPRRHATWPPPAV